MDLRRAGLSEHRHDLPGGGSSDDRVVHHDQSLAADGLGQRIQLQLHAPGAERRRRFDEGAADVAVLHEALAVGDAGRFGISLSGGVARVGNRDDQIGVGRRLAGQEAAHPAAGLVNAPAVEARIGP